MQQQRRSGLAFHVTATQQVAQVTAGGVVDYFARQRQFARFEDTDDDARAALLFWTAAPYAKFHGVLLALGLGKC